MKAKALITLMMFALMSCDTSVDQISKCKKPATVYLKHKQEHWYEDQIMIIKDADGNSIKLTDDKLLRALIDKYNTGDTIK